MIMLKEALAAVPGVTVLSFGWRRALTARFDVFHVHWPEILVSGRTPARAWVRRLLFVAFVLRLRLRRVPIVRTVHNLELPSGIPPVEVRLLQWLDRQVAGYVVLNAFTPTPDRRPAALVPHGHYRDWFARHPARAAEEGRIGYFGLIRRYKGVEDLVRAFVTIDDPTVRLSVAGRPSGPDLVRAIEQAAGGDPRVELRFGFLDDASLVDQVTRSRLVVLPYRHMHNSGGALTALSLDRPVLVPDNEVNRALQEEVGATWVQTYTGELTGEDLRRALQAVTGLTGQPDLSARAWNLAGLAHRDAFLAARSRARRARPT
ncbi:glycosyltransferase [Microlunatus kandeliicorticis]|uniref:glycosyltransferase n=1 Tax=Microlunatus kandeliicorticis TaxID=1759536 RepID=UPI001C71E2DF|nr:glycosyl transferase [Microlunatus kandeliicorticis]